MRTTDFQERVYALCRRVPAGRVTTYGEIASALKTRACRAVGQALRRNPYAPAVPCHRVVASDGSLGGFCGETSGTEPARKKLLLLEEGVRFLGDKIADFERTRFRFS
ncbi:MAG: MGMT family protein [Spirochaetales bacterium]|nr:MGMT family protein [Spirochaetales bacterium]